MVKQGSDIVDKERIQLLGNLFLVGELERAFERDPSNISNWHVLRWQMYSPNTLQMHRPDLDNMPGLLALQNSIPASTGHSCYVEQLRAVDHVVVYGWSILVPDHERL
jgi:hypothetical protein